MPPKRQQPGRAPANQRTPVKPSAREESSDDELSDLSDRSTPTSLKLPQPGRYYEGSDDDEDEEEGEEEEDSDSSDTPEGEVEDSYASEDEREESDDDESIMTKPPAKTAAKPAAPTARSTRRAPAAAARSAAKKAAPVSRKVGKAKGTITVSRTPRSSLVSTNTRPTRSSYARSQQEIPKLTSTATATVTAVPTIKLKIGKDRLRAATSSWTPPPGAADSAADSTAAGSPDSTTPLTKPIAPRGRKVVQEESSESEDDDEEDENEDVEMEDAEEDVDAEGEEEDLVDEDAEGETDDEMLDSDEGGNRNTPDSEMLSRVGTPGDMSRLTNRQRTRMGDITTADHLLELPSGYEKSGPKPVTLSAHEQELKRAEMARRRKNLTDQRLQEEKMDTINRLLKKQTPKMRRGGRGTGGDATPATTGLDVDGVMTDAPHPPTMIRWVSNKDGNKLGIPSTWLSAPIGEIYKPQQETERMQTARRKMVEEIS